MPESHPVIPLLVYEDIEAERAFLVDVFDLQPTPYRHVLGSETVTQAADGSR